MGILCLLSISALLRSYQGYRIYCLSASCGAVYESLPDLHGMLISPKYNVLVFKNVAVGEGCSMYDVLHILGQYTSGSIWKDYLLTEG